MKTRSLVWIVMTLGCSASSSAFGQSLVHVSGGNDATPRFAPPVAIQAGEVPLGSKRLYPSPALHDMDGDGKPEIVIGDLWGKLSVAQRLEGGGVPKYAEDKPLLGRDGKPLDFKNW